MTRILIISILIFLTSCGYGDYQDTDDIGKGFYVQMFVDAGGVFASDYYTYYLTDSLNIRKKIGSCDEDNYIKAEIINDTIFVYEKSLGSRNERTKIIKTTSFSIESIK